jgi:transposase
VREGITFVGLDAHKKSISVAMLVPGETPVEWTAANESGEIRRLIRKLERAAPGKVEACYEAGPTGYGLKRQLEAAGIRCAVVAPSLIPVKAGDRVKTDRRDARKLAEYLRAGILTEVHAPTPEEEAVRDLCRCREDAKDDQNRARHRLEKFLVRRSIIYTGGRSWTTTHLRWLRTLTFENEADRVTFGDYMHSLELLDVRVAGLDSAIEAISKKEPYAKSVGWLRCMRGIDTTTAMVIVAELHDVRRFETARALMAYLGLVPSEHSSGGPGKERRGAITRTGNTHVRRMLVESAHHARHKPAVSTKLRDRRDGQPPSAIIMADRAAVRLHRRYWSLVSAGKAPNKAKVAVARELAGFIWAMLRAAAGMDAAPQRERTPQKRGRTAPIPHMTGRAVLEQARAGRVATSRSARGGGR